MLDDENEIGALPLEWNWLVGEYPFQEAAKLVHFACLRKMPEFIRPTEKASPKRLAALELSPWKGCNSACPYAEAYTRKS